MNDHSDHRRREPEWPSGDEPDRGTGAEQSVERTGFWSPLWEEEDEAGRPRGGGPDAAGRPGPYPGPGGHEDFPGRPAPEDFNAPGAPVRPRDDFGAPGRGPGGPGGPVPPGGRGPGGPGGFGAAGAAAAGGLAAGGPAGAAGPGAGIPGAAGRGAPRIPGAPGGPGGPGMPGGPNGPNGPGNFPGPDGPGGGFPGGPGATRALNAPGEQPTMAVPPMSGDRRLPPGSRPIPPHDPGEDPTIYLHQNPGHSRGEPALLTHREPDYEDDYDDDYGPEDEDPLTDTEARALRRKKIWRRVRRTAYVGTALGIIIPVLAFFITYQMVEVESPQELAAKQDQAVTLLWADGSEITKLAASGANRQLLTYDQMPDIMRKAVYAAEDASFETNAGFDMTGILRAVWNQVSGGEGGGSTISQQYVKKASGDEDKTLTRKWTELVKSYKMNETYSKPDIITAYLNTIYFGRGAYGVAAAAKAYYNIDDLMTINKSQAALLAGMIQTPSRHKDTQYQLDRWTYVTGRMIANNWMTEAERQEMPFTPPVPLEETKGEGLSAPLKGRLPDLVFAELRKLGIDEDTVRRHGYKIQLTLDKTAQSLAEQAVTDVMQGQPAALHPGLVAVDPKTGHIRAYYPNSNGSGTDWAAAVQEPGSSFKPFDLVGLLKKDKGLYETYDSSPKAFGGSKVIKNASRPGCGECTVAQAMKESLNVVFSDMVYNDVKPKGVAEAAAQAGVRSPLDKAVGDINIAIGGGDTQVSTVDMASAYATFAANGVYRAPHLVSKVEKPDGTIVLDDKNRPEYQETFAFDQDQEKNQKIARNVTEALLPIPKSSGIPCAGDRLCAGKTGTHQYQDTPDNSKAWMVGYTPQLSTAVSLSGDKDNGYKLRDAKNGIIYGGGLPGKIWKKFMDSYHQQFKLPKENFGKFVAIGKPEYKEPPSTTNPPTTTTPPTEQTKPTKSTDPSESTEPTTTTTRSRPTRPTSEPGLPLPGSNW
ncbi:Membrane carboxypeptidase (penicillin-binding protein) [Actinokineospora alba]|uniref:Membrane carboxypeptidase (Penicillin-binding protein) n=1 Tax=Actinokineospora alba TaxID=504798 RepID=A0A1H0Q6I3_9PSEU|nr:transglycosylase domain-containing protein [Actinokineospora alba]TDP66072.1 membrane peptidoglycan carboxypeptidase [Actinokineospora alba]SDI58675.1 Membrane carboxypeptidase (penicillin-binding protein) [Actinokineospora alba]SDP12239.1 Membrane carboxypeptidase (penicillin-binding protein) [Actinokineospora alba]